MWHSNDQWHLIIAVSLSRQRKLEATGPEGSRAACPLPLRGSAAPRREVLFPSQTVAGLGSDAVIYTLGAALASISSPHLKLSGSSVFI